MQAEVDLLLVDFHRLDLSRLRLTEEDHAQAAGFRRALRRQQYLAGRFLLRGLLRRRFGAAAADWRIDSETGRPPRLRDAPVRLSVSHSDRWVAAAIGIATPLGVDVERNDRERDFVALSQLLGFELDPVSEDPQARRSAWYRHWVVYEARLKALADGGRDGTARVWLGGGEPWSLALWADPRARLRKFGTLLRSAQEHPRT